MSDTTILELTTASVVSETEDYIPMVDVSDTTESNDGTTKRATVRKLLKDKALPSGDIVGTSDEQTLENKTLTSPNITDVDITGGSVDDATFNNPTMDNVDITGGTMDNVDITANSLQVNGENIIGIGGLVPMLPVCLLNREETGSNLQALESGDWIVFPAGADLYDPLNCHSTSTNTERIVVPEDGVYFMTAYAKFTDYTTGSIRIFALVKNGTTGLIDGRYGFDPDGRLAITIAGVAQFSKGDYISIKMGHNVAGGVMQLRAASLCLHLVKRT